MPLGMPPVSMPPARWPAALAAALITYPPAAALAQDAARALTAATLTVTTRPTRLVKGALGTIRVRARAGHGLGTLRGYAAGEPLHFTRAADGSFSTLLAAPIEGMDTLDVSLATDSDSSDVRLPLADGTYYHEQLRVAEKYAKPDSAAQERIRGEIERAREVGHHSH